MDGGTECGMAEVGQCRHTRSDELLWAGPDLGAGWFFASTFHHFSKYKVKITSPSQEDVLRFKERELDALTNSARTNKKARFAKASAAKAWQTTMSNV